MIKNTMYTVKRVKKDDTFFDPSHGSADGDTTLCGEKLNSNWYITSNTFDGKITCKKCLKIMNNTKYYHELYTLHKKE